MQKIGNLFNIEKYVGQNLLLTREEVRMGEWFVFAGTQHLITNQITISHYSLLTKVATLPLTIHNSPLQQLNTHYANYPLINEHVLATRII